MMPNPYRMASRTPLFFALTFSSSVECLVVPLFRKKETVIGIMGQTQGVTSATNPPSKPNKKISQREESEVLLLPPLSKAESCAITGDQMEEDAEEAVATESVIFSTIRDESGLAILRASFCSAVSCPLTEDASFNFGETSSPALSSFLEERGTSPLKLNSTLVGGVQFLSSHAPYLR